MSNPSKGTRDRAEAQFEKKQRMQKEGAKAMSEYEAAGQAMRDKTARLRALRLAKEAKEAETAAAAPAVKKAPAKKKAAKAGAQPPLGEWLKNQQNNGRNS